MKHNINNFLAAVFLTGCVSASIASDICNIQPGSIVCGKGTVENLTGNGMVSTKGTIVSGPTKVNGLLSSKNTTFSSLNINGSVNLIQCDVTADTEVKGALKASYTRFNSKVDVYSNSITLLNTKVAGDLRILHTANKQQYVYLDDSSEVSGNVIFDDGKGEVVIRKHSKIGGKIIGGHLTSSSS